MKRLFGTFSLVVLILISPLTTADDFPPVRELMSAEDMKVTGLDKLNEEELQALREWLEVFVERDAGFAIEQYRERQKAAARAVKEQKQEVKRQTVAASSARKEPAAATESEDTRRNRFDKSYARIVGDFSGWNGKTRFNLDNGEVWQQRKPDSMRRMKAISNPEVKITKNFLGFYVMEVPAADVKVPVTRIR